MARTSSAAERRKQKQIPQAVIDANVAAMQTMIPSIRTKRVDGIDDTLLGFPSGECMRDELSAFAWTAFRRTMGLTPDHPDCFLNRLKPNGKAAAVLLGDLFDHEHDLRTGAWRPSNETLWRVLFEVLTPQEGKIFRYLWLEAERRGADIGRKRGAARRKQ